MHWRRKWQPTPVFLPGESQGRGSLVGCRLWGRTESDTTEATWQQQQFSVIMVSVCLPSDALLQHLPSYLGFSYLRHGVSLHSCCSKVQLLLLTLDKGYLLTAAPPDLQRGMAPLGPLAPGQPLLLGCGQLLPAAAPDLGHGVAPLGRSLWPNSCLWSHLCHGQTASWGLLSDGI